MTLNMESQMEMYLTDDVFKYGNCIDVESLRIVDMQEFLKEDNHIVVIINGKKYGERRTRLEQTLSKSDNIYKDSNGKYYIYSKYSKLIPMDDYFDFFRKDKKIFILESEDMKLANYKYANEKTNVYNHSFELFDFQSLSIAEYEY